ncbi:O-antigen ligase family protein [Streptomyces massasporeus]|uniref:O-antigen ligase family protein n=1 Tax=Streptomyces massasporeus TaxID=67324 RepID=UPI00364C9B3F
MEQKKAVDLRGMFGALALTVVAVGVWVAGQSVPLRFVLLLAVPVLVVLAVIAVHRPVLALAAVAVLLVSGDIDLPLGIPLVRLLALGAVVIVVTARLWGRGRPIGRSPLLAVMALLVTAALLSTIFGVDPSRALRQDFAYVVGLLLAAAIVMATVDQSDLLLLALALCLGGALLCVSALTKMPDFEVASSDAAVVSNRPVGVFAQPNELGLCAAMVFCFSFAMIILTRRQRRSWLVALCVVAALLALTALLLSLSRGAWIGTVVGLLVLALLLREARAALLCLATVVTIVLALLVVVPSVNPPVIAQRLLSVFGGPGNPYDERPAARAEAVVQMSERPVLGSGPASYPWAAQGVTHVPAARGEEHAHNLFLAVGAEQGVLGLTLLVTAVGIGAAAAIRNRGVGGDRPRDPTVRMVSAGSAAALAAVLGHGVVDYPLRNPIIATMTWLFIGLLAACARTRRTSIHTS